MHLKSYATNDDSYQSALQHSLIRIYVFRQKRKEQKNKKKSDLIQRVILLAVNVCINGVMAFCILDQSRYSVR